MTPIPRISPIVVLLFEKAAGPDAVVFASLYQTIRRATLIIAAGAPAALVPATAPNGFNISQQLTQVGGDPLGSFLSQVPPAAQAAFLNGFHGAFSIALANSMWVGVAAAFVAGISTLFLTELPLRATHNPTSEFARPRPSGSAAPAAD